MPTLSLILPDVEGACEGRMRGVGAPTIPLGGGCGGLSLAPRKALAPTSACRIPSALRGLPDLCGGVGPCWIPFPLNWTREKLARNCKRTAPLSAVSLSPAVSSSDLGLENRKEGPLDPSPRN